MGTYAYQMEAPVTEPPRRVVSLVPSVTESLFDLNLGNRLIAITDYCVFPEQAAALLPRIGGTKNPDVRRIIDLKPDLVIANAEENRPVDIITLQNAGIPVWVTFPKSVSDAINLLWNMMQVFDESSMVPRVRWIEQTLDWVAGVSQAREDRPTRVFVPLWFDPLMTFNADTYMHDLIRVCGGLNVFADCQRTHSPGVNLGRQAPYAEQHNEELNIRYPYISLQDVAAAQPDVILLPSEPFHFTDMHVPMFTALDVPAAHHGRVHLVDGSLLTWHGTRLAYALNTVPALLMPETSA